MSVYVGLDCGGSSTRVLAIDESGKAVFRGQAGPANLLSTPEAQVRSNLRAAALKCPKPVAVLGCFAGLIDETVRNSALGFLKSVFPGAKKLEARPDYVAALAACGKDTDACVISGTGSIVCSWRNSHVIKSGGRGPILGDVGSASHIGRSLLNAYLNDPSLANSTLKKAIAEIFGSAEESDLIRRLYADASPAAMLAKLGKVAAKQSLAGSVTVQQIIESEMTGLCKLAARHLRSMQLEKTSVRIGLAGGLWKSSPVYKAAFESCLAKELPDVKSELFILKRAPVEGAALLAKESFVGN